MPSQERPDDLTLLQQTAQGETAAFEHLYARYSTAVFNYLRRLVRRDEIAEELLQEVFVVVWQKAPLFEARASVKTWIFRIAHHKAVSWLRRRREHQPLSRLIRREERRVGGEQEALALEALADADALRRALEHLSPKHRAVIELAFGQQMTYKEIAIVLDCPLGTVKSRMKYALQNLERILQREGFHAEE